MSTNHDREERKKLISKKNFKLTEYANDVSEMNTQKGKDYACWYPIS